MSIRANVHREHHTPAPRHSLVHHTSIFGTAIFGTALLLTIGTACSTSMSAGGDLTTGVDSDGTPTWIQRGSGAYNGIHGRAFYGVGVVEGVDSTSLARQTAANRARAEVAKIFDSYIRAMMQDYQRSTSASNPVGETMGHEEQDVVSAQRTITDVTLRGVQIPSYWQDSNSGALYALAVLELGELPRALDATSRLSATMRDYVRANARRAFDDLDRELSKGRTPAASEDAEEPTSEPVPSPAASADGTPDDRLRATPPASDTASKGRIGLRVSGRDARTIQTCFAQRLIQAGYTVLENSSDVDLMLAAELRYARAGSVNDSVLVQATVDVRVTQQSDNELRAALLERVKVSRPDLQQALLTASTKLCNVVVPKIVAQIDQPSAKP